MTNPINSRISAVKRVNAVGDNHGGETATQMKRAPSSQGVARPGPVQRRSRERLERILACAIEVMAEKGSDAFRMSDLVERTKIPFGSLYQYFPDKTAVIATLAERYNAIGRACVRKEISALTDLSKLHAVLGGIADSYFQYFIDEPAVFHIWQATQADRELQRIDEEDGAHLTGMLFDALRPIARDVTKNALADFCQVVMVTIAAAVRHAITLPPKEGRRAMRLFKRLLPRDLTAAGP